MKKINIAVIGASGLVGQKIVQIIIELKLIDKVNLFLYVSERNAGKKITIENINFDLNLLNEEILKTKFDIVFFCANEEISLKWAKPLLEKGSIIIDNSNAFRKIDTVPLVVPEINKHLVLNNTKLISNPNCSTIQLAIIINRLLKLSEINKIIVSTYQSVSGAGKDALCDLKNGTSNSIKEGIADNLVLKIGNLEKNEFCVEENKIMTELNKILNKKICIFASTVRVPISYCHTESVYVQFTKKINIQEVYETLKTNYIIVDRNEITQPKAVKDTNMTHICRIRQISDTELLFFIVADNIRRGASYNAVKIAEFIIENYLTK